MISKEKYGAAIISIVYYDNPNIFEMTHKTEQKQKDYTKDLYHF